MATNTYTIRDFAGGINEAVDTSLLQANQAEYARNVDISDGSLKPSKGLSILSSVSPCPINIEKLMVYYHDGIREFVVSGSGKLYIYRESAWLMLGENFANNKWDFINYNYNNVDVMILVNGVDNNKILEGITLRNMKDRRISYDALGVINGYYDADGVLRTTEAEVTTLAPISKFVELHFERIWLASDKSVYFSKDFDPEDYSIPTDEIQANQHGGEIVMESFDATKIIGLKVVFNDVVIFKEKSLYKIVGAYAEQYEKIQLFNFNGAIADGSIVVTAAGGFFLNSDGIYLYDGVNCTLISDKLRKTVASLDTTQIVNAIGTNFNNKYILCAYKDVTEGWITIEYEYLPQIFTVHQTQAKGYLGVVHDLYAIKGDTLIYEYGKGSYLPLYWRTGASALDSPSATKECEDVYFTGKGTSVSLTLRTEKKDKTKLIAMANDKFRVYRKPLISFGRIVQFIFSTNANDYCEIAGFNAMFDTDED